MRILVTGGRGYLGGRISNSFLELGHEVTITTRRLEKNLSNNPILKFVSPDWGSELELLRICGGMDLVIHAAGMNAAACEQNPSLAVEFNGNTTGRLVRAAAESGVRAFVYLSTAHVYSNPPDGYVDEDSLATNSHPYATSHLIGESKVLESGSLSGSAMKKHVIRLSNIYGSPHERTVDCWELFINRIAKQIVIKDLILFRSDSSQRRDFLAMSNFLNLIIGISDYAESETLPNIINFGSGTTMKLLDVANKISEIAEDTFGYTSKILFNELRIKDKNIDFEYGTKYESILNSFRTSSMETEIRLLLNFTTENFSQEHFRGK